MPPTNPQNSKKTIVRGATLGALFLCLGLCTIIFYFATVSSPASFRSGTFFSVQDGETVSSIATSLKSAGYIRSEFVFKVIVRVFFLKDDGAVAGEYFFDQKLNAVSIARRIVSGNFHVVPVKITVPEGLQKTEVAQIIKNRLSDFDDKKFIALADEGYLFPDTYFFEPNISPEKAIAMMRKNFDEHVGALQTDILLSGRNLSDIIKMASIVETEARQTETRQIIAGILWKRIEMKMPLQVDVSFKYINGKGTSDLTDADLKLDSPYNSYKYLGLPPTPISNPGIDSIRAALFPQKTSYLYFLSDQDGVMHYATTFEEHKKNKLLYLR